MICNEGDSPDALFIILSGGVHVFTYDVDGQKIILASLHKGDYFGEQAIIGQGRKTRNASIETIEETTLIRIDTKAIIPLWQENKEITAKLKKIGYEQALLSLSTSIKIYNELKVYIEKIKKGIREYQNGEIIFKAGDPPKNVYYIIDGKVKLQIPNEQIKN